MAVGKNLRVTINFYRKQNLPVITQNNKHLSKQVVAITYTLEKRSLTAAILLKVCESFLSRQSKYTCSILGLYESFLDFQRRGDQANTVNEN